MQQSVMVNQEPVTDLCKSTASNFLALVLVQTQNRPTVTAAATRRQARVSRQTTTITMIAQTGKLADL